MMNEKIHEFFSQYEQRFTEALAGKDDVEATAAAFASSFLEASPAGVQCGENNEQFRNMIPKGNEMYRRSGMVSMKVHSLDITPLDQLHYMVKVHWNSVYRKKDGSDEPINFEVIYFLQHLKDELKIFAYIAGDEQKVLQEHGIETPKE
ncbi:hypothetical protein HHL16_23035 [Pseudoflavitalea sp. G-6-1-2]|uniref:hypothetical protein n=1 Tax=Pseudoflavitalea sp. G-6-1-2 TaxID=2728841 RepID=UPI00146D887D|nr:hypothetical protein [Pseudoflavitalea sp. G-6-1-2]NML23775.1 hypothetical protein [Pseudoflavitalea sp. G-6-1-2]